MKDCEQARIGAMDGQDVAHVRECPDCRAFVADYRKIAGLLHSDEPMPIQLQEKLATLGKPRKILRMFVAAGLGMAAAVLIILPFATQQVQPPPVPVKTDVAQADVELDMIKSDIERMELKARVIGLQVK